MLRPRRHNRLAMTHGGIFMANLSASSFGHHGDLDDWFSHRLLDQLTQSLSAVFEEAIESICPEELRRKGHG